jgi:hypothetical protein
MLYICSYFDTFAIKKNTMKDDIVRFIAGFTASAGNKNAIKAKPWASCKDWLVVKQGYSTTRF